MKLTTYQRFTLINIFAALSLFIVSPFLAPYLEDRGFLSWQISLIFTFAPLANILFQPYIGKLADTFPRSFIIWFGILFEIIALILYLINGSPMLIIVARLLDGIAAVTVPVIIIAKIQDGLAEKTRGKFTGILLSFGYVGQLVGPVIGGVLADYFFIAAPFFTSLAILIILLFLLFKEWYPQIKKFKHKPIKLSWSDSVKTYLSHRPLIGSAILGPVMHATNPAMGIFLPLYIIDYLRRDYKFIGIAMFALGIAHLFQGWFGTKFDKIGHWKGILLGCVITAITIMLIPFSNMYWLLLIILFIHGAGTSLWNVTGWSFMSRIGEKEKIEGQVVTSYFSIAKMGELASYIISALLVIYVGFEAVFVFNGVLILVGVAASYPYLKRKEE